MLVVPIRIQAASRPVPPGDRLQRWCSCAIPWAASTCKSCSAPTRDAAQVLAWFVQRWQLEVTFREVRDHLGVETQRQWSDKVVARATPCLVGLFSLVTLLGRQLTPQARRATAAKAWYRRQQPTFSDTLSAVRHELWRERGFVTSARTTDMRKLPPALRNAVTYAFCHAA